MRRLGRPQCQTRTWSPLRCIAREQTAGGGGLFVVSKVMDLCYFGVVAQVIRHEPRVSVSFFHADALRGRPHSLADTGMAFGERLGARVLIDRLFGPAGPHRLIDGSILPNRGKRPTPTM